jgi:hypothetical protein
VARPIPPKAISVKAAETTAAPASPAQKSPTKISRFSSLAHAVVVVDRARSAAAPRHFNRRVRGRQGAVCRSPAALNIVAVNGRIPATVFVAPASCRQYLTLSYGRTFRSSASPLAPKNHQTYYSKSPPKNCTIMHFSPFPPPNMHYNACSKNAPRTPKSSLFSIKTRFSTGNSGTDSNKLF